MQSKKNSPEFQVVPDSGSKLSKKEQVAAMFNNIAGRYDFLNHFLSLGIDKGWRKKAIKEASKVNPNLILDIATGTGDLAIAAISLNPNKIIGVDIAQQMLDEGIKKIAKLNLTSQISFQLADSEALPFDTASFDAITCAFGVRNFEHLEAGLKEMYRVLRKGGRVVILEFSQPHNFPIKQLYNFYFKFILPIMGKIVSKHQTAYTYLPESVMAFPQGNEFCNILKNCGFKDPFAMQLTFGICSLYVANK